MNMILLRKLSDGRYDIVDGYFRVRAAKRALINMVKCQLTTGETVLIHTVDINFVELNLNAFSIEKVKSSYNPNKNDMYTVDGYDVDPPS